MNQTIELLTNEKIDEIYDYLDSLPIEEEEDIDGWVAYYIITDNRYSSDELKSFYNCRCCPLWGKISDVFNDFDFYCGDGEYGYKGYRRV